jgi:hypothetical protein
MTILAVQQQVIQTCVMACATTSPTMLLLVFADTTRAVNVLTAPRPLSCGIRNILERAPLVGALFLTIARAHGTPHKTQFEEQ